MPRTPVLAGLKAIDWTGSLLIIGSALMVLLGLEFGGVTFPWSSAAVICLITFGTVVLGMFLVNEWKLATNPVVPLRLFSNGSTVAAYMVYVCNFSVLIGLSYYLPLYSQSVLGSNALKSGLHLLPLIVSSSLAAACTGVFIQKTGIYLPIMYGAQVLLTLGAGLFLNLAFEKNITRLVVYQIITGAGIGLNMEPPLLVAQATATALDTAAVISTMSFLRSICTAIIVVVGGVLFQGQMVANNGGLAAQIGQDLAAHFNGEHATASVEMIGSLPADVQEIIRRTYFQALRAVWIMVSICRTISCHGKVGRPESGNYHANRLFIQCVAVAGISLISNIFVRAHRLSSETKGAVLGLERAREEENTRQQRQLGTSSQTHSIELTQVREESLRLRS